MPMLLSAMNRKRPGRKSAAGDYPATRTSPWFFLALAAATLVMILAGVFHIDPITRVLHWLAVVL